MSQELPDGVELPRHIAQGADLEWQARIFHEEMDKLGVPRDDGEDFYSLIGRANLALADREKQAARVPEAMTPQKAHEAAPKEFSYVEAGSWMVGWNACRAAMLAVAPTTEPSKAEQAEGPKEPMRAHVETFAAGAGWVKDDGEGAFEFVQRKCYHQGWQDGRREALGDVHRDTPELATQPTASPEQADAPRWPNVETAMEDPLFQRARALMGTENWFQDNALRNVINYVLSATGSALQAENAKLREDIAEMVRSDADHALATLCAEPDTATQPPASNAGERELLNQALDALSTYQGFIDDAHILEGQWHWLDDAKAAEASIRAALATKPQAGDVAQDKEQAENYRLIRRGQHWSVVDGIGNTLRGDDLDAAVDAIRAARTRGEGGGT